jgi:anthranilate phosphoribosyltransferase
MREYIASIIGSKDLSREEAYEAMSAIMGGGVSDALISAFLTALKIKGETVDEISGFSDAMLEKAKKVEVKGMDLVDTCGTGGDELNTFNISTTAAFIAAGAGVNIAKHGNRSVSSRSGSADVLESCGVQIELGPEAVAECIEKAGMGFIYARMAHSAMKYVAPVRQELGMRTVFNILGPITNPAMANGRVLGVYDVSLLGVMAGALRNLGVERAFIINSENGMDELSTASRSKVVYLEDGYITEYMLDPAKLGFKRAEISELKGGDAGHNAILMKDILSGKIKGPMRDTAVLNAAAAIIAGKLADRMEDSLRMAEQSLDEGRALEKLEKLVEVSNRLAGGKK